MSLPEIKLCDVFGKKDSNNEDSFVAHIIFKDDVYTLFKNNTNLLNQELIKIQNKVYELTGEYDMVPKIFKIRTEFPHAKSGKRDINKIMSETEGFIEINGLEKPKVKKY